MTTIYFTRHQVISVIFLIVVYTIGIKCQEEKDQKFPQGFAIGTATSSYQIEGAWNISDKGENVWDHFTHRVDSTVHNKSTGDVACNSYHLYKEDVKIIKQIGFDFYRFSISWGRILPNGFANYVSKDGLKYYHNLLDELIAKGIKPYVTLYHWDHPQTLEKLGGWTNELMVQWFTDYARVVFRELGPKIKTFFTVNEPYMFCGYGYGNTLLAPGTNMSGIASYLCGHNVLKAHASVYHLYNKEFRKKQKGTIGIVNICNSYISKTNDTKLENDAFQFTCGWFSHPIFSKTGDYPSVMKKLVKEDSLRNGWPKSRLPEFSKKWIKFIRGTSDFFGLNHYTSQMIEPGKSNETNLLHDFNAILSSDPKWPRAKSFWLAVVPEGFRMILLQLKKEYGNIPIHITENGYSDHGVLWDENRVEFYYSYLKEMLKAIHQDGCNVQSFTAWSLLDNFEWGSGYSDRFGIVHVDFDKPSRQRTLKYSAKWFRSLLKVRKLSMEYK